MTSLASTLPRWARSTLVAVGTAQIGLKVGGRIVARRLDVGEETSARIRRVLTLGQLSLRPDSQELARIEVDLVLAGVALDLRATKPAPGGVDLILGCVLAGGDVWIPGTWGVSWESRGIGGLTIRGDLVPAPPAAADLRLDVRALAGGVTLHVG